MNYAGKKGRVVRPCCDDGLIALREALAGRGFALKPEGATPEGGERGGLEATVQPGGVRLRIERRSSVQSVLNAVRGGLSTVASRRRLLFPADMLRKYELGILARPEEPESFAEAILRLVDNRSLAHRMGQAGQQAFREKYCWEIQTPMMLKFYEDIMLRD